MSRVETAPAYWSQPEVAATIRRALGMDEPAVAVATAPTVRPGPHRKAGQAACHPDRRVAHKDLCIECYLDERFKKKGRTRPDMTVPQAIPGVRQNAVYSMPSKCPKCRNRLLEVRDRMVHCPGTLAGCGWTGWLVVR